MTERQAGGGVGVLVPFLVGIKHSDKSSLRGEGFILPIVHGRRSRRQALEAAVTLHPECEGTIPAHCSVPVLCVMEGLALPKLSRVSHIN